MMRVALLSLLSLSAAVDISVSPKHIYNVTAMTYGVNTPNYIGGKFVDSHGASMFKATGATHLRWPGGNWANMIIWNNDYAVCPYFAKYKSKNAAWTWQWSEAGAFAKEQGLEVLWQVNAAVGLVCGPNAAAKLAADFVTSAMAAGIDVNYIEVGNENYGKWEVPYKDYPTKVSPEAYTAVCTAVAKAVKAVRPAIAVGCVGDLVRGSSPNTPFLDWNEKVLAGAGTNMDFLIIHEYYTKVVDGDTSAWNLLNYGCSSDSSSFIDTSSGSAPAGHCCWSKWGAASTCGNYPSGGTGGICDNDAVTKCKSDDDCSAVKPTPGPSPGPPTPTPPPAPRPPGKNCGPHNIAIAVKDDVAKHAPLRKSPLPIMITEYNMEQPFQTETWSLVEGLFAAKHLGESMEAGIMGSTFFALFNGKSPDFGMFSEGDTPVAYAPVHAFAIFTRVAPVGSTMLGAKFDSQSLNVSAYAFARPEKDFYGVVLVNTGAESKTVTLSGPWEQSGDLEAWVHTLSASSSAEGFAAQNFNYNGVNGPAKGGPYPLDKLLPKKTAFTGSVTLSAASVTGLIIAPSSAPLPTPSPPPPPTPPAPVAKCCVNGGCSKCHSPGFCTASKDNCMKHCSGNWCPPQAELVI